MVALLVMGGHFPPLTQLRAVFTARVTFTRARSAAEAARRSGPPRPTAPASQREATVRSSAREGP